MLTNLPFPYDIGVGILISYLKCESTSGLFQPGEGLSRGLLRDCVHFAEGSLLPLEGNVISVFGTHPTVGLHKHHKLILECSTGG